MISKVRFHIDGHPDREEGLEVKSYDFTFTQTIDQSGQPQGRVCGGVINLTIANLSDTDIFSWMLSNTAKKNGKIITSSNEEKGQLFQTIELVDALLVNYHQTYNEGFDLLTHLTLSCKEVKCPGSTHKNPWNTSES